MAHRVETIPARGSAAPGAASPISAASTAPDRFRSDLEGLRAVAVLLVLLYHAEIPGFGGGFVGVDVFFVLSGFLITGLIVRELAETGTVSLPAFYARRARRLLPAALLVIVVTVVVSVWLLPPLRIPDIAGDGASAALYVSNIRFAVQSTDYLQSTAAPSPLLHYWSLGVEEQFYLLWPALLLIVAGRRAGGVRRIAFAIVVVAAASLVLSIVLTGIAAPWAFFSLPTRAWELALGAIIAVSLTPLSRLTERQGAAACAIGIGLIVVSALVIGPTTPFPGLAALLPTVGTALVIAAGVRPGLTAPGRLLSQPPFRFLGRISYSLYLWHWPILVVPAAALETGLAWPARVALALLSIPVAAASQRWVEEPIHRGRLLERIVGLRPSRNLAAAGAFSLTVALLSVGAGAAFGLNSSSPITPLSNNLVANEQLLHNSGTPSAGTGSGASTRPNASHRSAESAAPATAPTAAIAPRPSQSPAGRGPNPDSSTNPGGGANSGASTAPAGRPSTPHEAVPANLEPPLARARDDNPIVYSDGCHLNFYQTESGTCVYGDAASHTTVVLFGDSHAAHWFPALQQLAEADHLRLVSLTKSACSVADVHVWNSALLRTYTECDTWRANTLARIAAEHPALVVVSEDRLYQVVVNGAPVDVKQAMATWNAGLAKTLRQLRATSGAVALIGDTPRSNVDPPVCLSAHLSDSADCATPLSDAIDRSWMAAEQLVTAASGVRYVDPTPLVCPSDPCPVVIGRVLVYRDEHHLTATFSAVLARRLGLALHLGTG